MKNVIITGASRGIGRACAIKFAEAGYGVLVNYLNSEKKADETVEECLKYGVKAVKFCADVKNEDDVRRMIAFAECYLGEVSVLVNNAGVSSSGIFTDFSREMYDTVFNTNVYGQMVCARAAAKAMISAGGGRIINVSSMWGLVGASCEVLYSASKAAVIGFTKALAKELAPSHITVNCVAPGVIDTDMNSCYDSDTMESLVEQTPLSRLGTPDDVASAVLFLASQSAGFITGETINVSGGFVI